MASISLSRQEELSSGVTAAKLVLAGLYLDIENRIEPAAGSDFLTDEEFAVYGDVV